MLDVIRRECSRAGSQLALSKEIGVNQAQISHALCERRPIAPRLARALGYEFVMGFRKRGGP